MVDRRPIQQAHERAYVEHFLSWFNRVYRSDFKVVNEPNPPEAIICSSRSTRWVEVSTALWNEAYAKDLYSYATPDEEHKPIGSGPFQDIDQRFAQSFVSVVKKKLEKKSYMPWRDKHGPGYLVVPIKYLWFDGTTVRFMKEAWSECSINDLGCFRSVLIAYPSCGNIRFSRWSAK